MKTQSEETEDLLAPNEVHGAPKGSQSWEGQQNLLLDELNHRVKNMLATIQSIAIQSLKGTDSPARDIFLARLFGLASQYDLLISNDWKGASLEGVVRLALRPYRQEGCERFIVSGPPVHLTTKRALAMGMGFHELAINAAKYGALSNATGQVQVLWRIEAATIHLTWKEIGGPPVVAPAKKGFGLRLIEQGLAREISGSIHLTLGPEGLVCSWDMPLA